MNEPEIKYFKGIVNTEVYPYIMDAYGWLLRDGLTDGAACPAWDDNAIIAYLDNAPVGALTWCKNEWCKTITVRLGWVSGGFRQNGIYTKMWKCLLQKAKEEKIQIIDGYTSPKNTNMQAVMEKLGRKKYAIGYRFTIEESAE